MRRCLGMLLLVSMFAVFAPRAAHAQDNPKKAREAFNEGRRYFDLGEFDKAIESWQKAYQYKADPSFLYNIAQAYRQQGNLQKAIFFYKSYLRNSPDARNRDEVEEKIATLQKALDAQAHSKEMPPPGPLTPEKEAETAKAEIPTATTTAPPPPPPVTAAGAPPAESVTTHATTERPGPIDLGVSAGVDVWASGAPVDPSLGLTVTGGYKLGALSTESVETRLGGRFGLTFVSEGNTDTFASILVDPMVFFTLVPDRLRLSTDLGVGLLVISGLTPMSAFLSRQAQQVTGALTTFELRPSVGLEYAITPSFAVSLSPALIYSPQPNELFVESSIVRFEIPVGVSLRL